MIETVQSRIRKKIDGLDVILCGVTGLEYQDYFSGWSYDTPIEVYSARAIDSDYIHCYIVNEISTIPYILDRGTKCATFEHIINQLLSQSEDIDIQPILEGLANYYYSNGDTFTGLRIDKDNIDTFNRIKIWAIEYYNEL